MFRFKFKLKFLDTGMVLDAFTGHSSFENIFQAQVWNEVFIRIDDSRFNGKTVSTQALKDLYWYKLFHPIKMFGYKVGLVALWNPKEKSIIMSLYRGRKRKNIFL